MLERMEGLPHGIDGVKAAGQVTGADYRRVIEPMIEEAQRSGRQLRFMYHLGPEFEGFSAGGAWQDIKLTLRAMRLVAGCAIVSDIKWVRASARLLGSLMPCALRVFDNQQEADAIDWLDSLPGGAAVSLRPIPEIGVIVVDVEQPLRVQDFDALAVAADSWKETERELRGLVIHTRSFPGWKSVGSFIRHLQFVRDHHREVHRVALAADSRLASVAPRIANALVATEVKGFDYDQVDDAVAWAGTLQAAAPPRAPAQSA